MDKKKQSEKVLALLKSQDTWSTLALFQACAHVGVTRMSARIWDLRQEGHKIMTDPQGKGKGTFYTYRGWSASPQLDLI